MPTSPEQVADGFKTYGVYYAVAILVVGLLVILGGFAIGKFRFSREVESIQAQLDANNAIALAQETARDEETAKNLADTREELRQTKELVNSLTKQQEKLTTFLEGIRDDVRDIKRGGGGRSA